MKTMVTYSPTALFAFVRLIEALVAIQGACAGLWQHAVQSITPMWLQRHLVLKEKLKEIGVTHHYDLQEVRSFKKHIVETRSDPMWRRAWWIHKVVARFTLIVFSALLLVCFGFLIAGFVRLDFLACLISVCAMLVAIIVGGFLTTWIYSFVSSSTERREHVTWHKTTLDDLFKLKQVVPEEAIDVHRTVVGLGGHTCVDDARRGRIYVDPFLYISAVPMWVSCIPGLRFLRMCVLQWGDDEFETGGFAASARRPL